MADDNKSIEELLAEIEAKAEAERKRKAAEKAKKDADKKKRDEQTRKAYAGDKKEESKPLSYRTPQTPEQRKANAEKKKQQQFESRTRNLQDLVDKAKKEALRRGQAYANNPDNFNTGLFKEAAAKYESALRDLNEHNARASKPAQASEVIAPSATPKPATTPGGGAPSAVGGVNTPARTSQRGEIPTARTAFQGGVDLIKGAAAKAGLDLSTSVVDTNSPAKPKAPQPTGDPETDRENRRIYAQSLQGWETAYNNWLAQKDAAAKDKLSQTLPGGGSGYGTGGSTTRSVTYGRDYLSPTQARGTIDQVLEQYYGRTPGSADYDHFMKMIKDAQKKNPVKTVTVTKTSGSGNSRSTQTSTGGVDPTQLAIEKARGTVEGQAVGLDGMFRGAMQILADRIG